MSKKGHHGGAWKVAYADFVTAMMALFMVLWLTAQDQKIKEAVERAFRKPFSSAARESTGVIPNDTQQLSKESTGNFDSTAAIELTMLRRLSEDLIKTFKSEMEEKDNSSVQLEMTPEGLRITVFDRSRKAVFENQSSRFTTYGDWVFSTLAWEVARYNHSSFQIELEGHTQSGMPPIRDSYGDWEISADRANSARRKLLEHGVVGGQVRKVVGFASTQPMVDRKATDEINRRVTVMLKVRDKSN